MTYHFVNIITWEYFFDKNLNNATIMVDGFLLKLTCSFFGVKTKKKSGLNFFHNEINDSYCFLLPSPGQNFTDFFVLPFWKEENDICITDELREFIRYKTNIVIGISAPKQDHLANLIDIEFPDKKIYCLGAAVTTSRFSSREWLIITWPTMFYNNPIRTLSKLKLSLLEIFNIIFSKRKRKKFILFTKKISYDRI
jgi:hypothetical protein